MENEVAEIREEIIEFNISNDIIEVEFDDFILEVKVEDMEGMEINKDTLAKVIHEKYMEEE